MFALLALTALAAGSPTSGPEPARVLVTLNDGGDYQPGDQVRVEVQPDEDGYLVVFRVDGDGYLRVLFPLDPDLDQFVRGGGRYELRGRGERASFLADDRGGTGMVFAVLSREPLAFDRYAAGSHWDYERLRLEDPAGDVEAQLLGIVRTMSDNGRFDYDAVGYRVWGPGYQAEPTVVVAGGGGYGTIDPWYDPFYYDPAFSCLACGWGYRTGIGFRLGGPWNYGYVGSWWEPWRDDWYGYNYGYTRGWNGWWGWDPYVGTPYRPYTVINTPPRPVVVDARTGLRSRPRQPTAGGLTSQPRVATVPGAGSGAGSRPTTGTEGRGRARVGGTSLPVRAAPSRTSSPAASPAGRSSSPPAAGSDRSRSRGRPDDLAIESGSLTPSESVTRPAVERPVYRPPTSTSLPSSRRTAGSVAPSSSRPSSSPPPRRDDTRTLPSTSSGRSGSVLPSGSNQPRSAGAPPRTSTSLPRSSSMPRSSSSSAPRSTSIPRSSNPAPSRSSAMPSRGSSSMPSAGSIPSRSSSAPSRAQTTRSAPASSGSSKGSAPARPRGDS